ncbi:MAG: hypothetical protein JWM26_2494 [Betaproteobacteria bacterium]|nr:hypothetical protein [Betaproteobacteria bacterium]
MLMNIDLLQWPAMAVTITAAWLVGAQSRRKRTFGFWVFLLSNLLWSVWGWSQGAYALLILQLFLAGTNIRGIFKNDPELKVTKAAIDEPASGS